MNSPSHYLVMRTWHHTGHGGHGDDKDENPSEEAEATGDQDPSLPSPPLWAQLCSSLPLLSWQFEPPMSFLPPQVIVLICSSGHVV